MAQEPPVLDLTQEVRFAVVMYGGISLAIYMNGVAQELLKLSRATAVGESGESALRSEEGENRLVGTELVYRRLGQILARGEEAGDLENVAPDDPIRTRFVVDVVSGSSAGGLNGVYLAKALACDEDMESLKKLWRTKADIGVLINDGKSVEDTKLAGQAPPRSLLNGERMYWEMLDALKKMDGEAPGAGGGGASPNVDELDLYVTATDIRGQVVPLQLADRPVAERRHRNVFHFRYNEWEPHPGGEGPRNDFRSGYNPFLAFAARCTAAHPAAFDPIRLADIDAVLAAYPFDEDDEEKSLRSCAAEWHRFYEEYLTGPYGKPPKEFRKRYFNDGGVLDNYPFRYATDAMPLRSARVPVERKLVYIDPAPEFPELQREVERSPNFFENAWLSLSPLPRYESIREDLQRVLERNRLIDRVKTIFGSVEDDLMASGAPAPPGRRYTDREWGERTMADMVEERGRAWVAYQHLRVTAATDDLARVVSGVAGLREDSDGFRAVRRLVRHWREKRFHPDREGGKRSELDFLLRFDYAWRTRRLKFVLDRLDETHRSLRGGPRRSQQSAPRLALMGLESPDDLDDEQKASFRRALLAVRKRLGEVDRYLLEKQKRLWDDAESGHLRGLVKDLELDKKDLETLLDPYAEREEVEGIFAEKEAGLEAFGKLVEDRIGDVLKTASDRSKKVWTPNWSYYPTPTHYQAALRIARFYYDRFECYDMVSYPVLYSTGVGEELSPTEVFRVSPADAPSLISETPDRPKLAGMKVRNFGGFFEEEFRTNDIMWGRLDGAERIISALLPREEDREKRNALIKAAHRAILAEEQPERYGPPEVGGDDDTLVRFRRDYEAEYEAVRDFDGESLLRNTARATRVFGEMLEGYEKNQSRDAKRAAWITRVGRLFWGLVEVAVPNSVWNLLWRHWLKLLYFFETLAIVLGTMLITPAVQQFGILALGVTVAAHAAVLFLGDVMRGGALPEAPGGAPPERGLDEVMQSERRLLRIEKRLRWRLRYARIALLVLLLATLASLTLALAALGLPAPQRLVELLSGVEVQRPPLVVRGAFAIVFAVFVVGLWVFGEWVAESLKKARE